MPRSNSPSAAAFVFTAQRHSLCPQILIILRHEEFNMILINVILLVGHLNIIPDVLKSILFTIQLHL